MRVVVFGASGRTGRRVVDQARARGHEVVAFLRDPTTSTVPEGVHVVGGDARDPVVVAEAIRDADAVISVLALMSPDAEPQHSDATRTIVEAAERAEVRRIVVTANNDALGDHEVTGGFAPHAREHRRNRDALRSSGLDWTIGAAPWVTDEPVTGRYDAVLDGAGPGTRISATDFATFAVDALEHDDWIGHLVGVSAA